MMVSAMAGADNARDKRNVTVKIRRKNIGAPSRLVVSHSYPTHKKAAPPVEWNRKKRRILQR